MSHFLNFFSKVRVVETKKKKKNRENVSHISPWEAYMMLILLVFRHHRDRVLTNFIWFSKVKLSQMTCELQKLSWNISDISAIPEHGQDKGLSVDWLFPMEITEQKLLNLAVISLRFAWPRNSTKMYLSKSLPEMVNPGQALISTCCQEYLR